MSAKASKKTNAMRELERAGVTFCEHTYEVDESDLSGVHVCAQLGEDPAAVFKTLVCATASGGYAVCCIPVAETLDLKAAARVLHEKSLSMLHMRDLLDVTGYIRGGCSPIGMKKNYPIYIQESFPTVIDETCVLFDTIYVSGGRRGLQVELAPDDLVRVVDAKVAAITQ